MDSVKEIFLILYRSWDIWVESDSSKLHRQIVTQTRLCMITSIQWYNYMNIILLKK